MSTLSERAAELQKAYEKKRKAWAKEIGRPYPPKNRIPNRVTDVPILDEDDDEEG